MKINLINSDKPTRIVRNKLFDKRWLSVLILFLIVLLSFFIGFYAYYNSQFWPFSPDTVNIALGSKDLATDGQFHGAWNILMGYEPNVNYPTLYPLIQILILYIMMFFQLDSLVAIHYLAIAVNAFIPLVVYLISLELFKKNRLIAVMSSFFALTSLSLSRSILLTPQNTIGYFFALIVLLFFIKYLKYRKNSLLLLAFLLAIINVLMHPLSGFIIIIFILISLLIYKKGKRNKLIIVTIFLIPFVCSLYLYTSSFYRIIDVLIGNNLSINYPVTESHKIWEIPGVLGYVLCVLGVYGILQLYHNKYHFRHLILVLSLILLFFSQSHYIGFNLVPDRFTAFLWIPLVFAAPLGYFKILDSLRKIDFILLKRTPVTIFISCIIISSFIHNFNHLIYDYEVWGNSIIPHEEDIEAMQWLKDNGTGKNILSTAFGIRQQSYLLPFFYEGYVVRYTEDLGVNPRDLKINLAPRGIIGYLLIPFLNKNEDRIVSKYNQKLNKRIDIYEIIILPDQESSQQIMDKYDIEYFYTWEGTREDTIYENSESFDLVYNNSLVNIYKR